MRRKESHEFRSRTAASGDRLQRRQVIGSRGRFPVSVTTRGRLVYVLNALNGGSVQAIGWPVAGCTTSPGRGGIAS